MGKRERKKGGRGRTRRKGERDGKEEKGRLDKEKKRRETEEEEEEGRDGLVKNDIKSSNSEEVQNVPR